MTSHISAWLLIKAENVTRRIAESRGDLGRVHTDRLDDLAAIGDDGIGCRGNTVDHDVDQDARIMGWPPALYPGAAHFTHRIVKSDTAVATLSDLPAKNFLIKTDRDADLDRRNLDVTNFSV